MSNGREGSRKEEVELKIQLQLKILGKFADGSWCRASGLHLNLL